ncbi:MAG: hypothetical protein JXL84_19730 [Deltaproteobacteria bacterium]|nr:hypothetical protein [Deltaproteobacteria bacterium]
MLKEMKERIDQIEALVLELKKLGEGVPMVESNARCLLSYVWALKFAISDAAEVSGN